MIKRFAVSLCLLAPLSSHAADPWVDQWLTNKTSSGASYYQGQERGYASFGSLSARLPMNSQFPITVAPPHLKSGCGGIDVFLGGVSFLDPEYLVGIMQGMLNKAPFVAFDMALTTMCKQCAETMAKAQELSAYLNGLTLNDCALSKKSVAMIMDKDDHNVMSEMWDEVSQGRAIAPNGTSKNPQDHKARSANLNGGSETSTEAAVADCSAEFLSIYKVGNLLENLASKTGMTDYVEVMRGYMGDVKVAYDATRNLFTATPLDSCPKNKDQKFDAMVYGTMQKMKLSDDTCVADGSIALKTYVGDKLKKIALAYKTNVALAAEEIALLNELPFPIASELKTAVMRGVGDIAATNYALPMAYLYAGQNMNDLFTRIDEMAQYGKILAAKGALKAGGDPALCRTEMLTAPIVAVERMQAKAMAMRAEIGRELMFQLQAMATTNQINRDAMAAAKTAKNEAHRAATQ